MVKAVADSPPADSIGHGRRFQRMMDGRFLIVVSVDQDHAFRQGIVDRQSASEIMITLKSDREPSGLSSYQQLPSHLSLQLQELVQSPGRR